MREDLGQRAFEADQLNRKIAAEAHQKEREILFANEAFLIGVLQVVSGGSLFAGLSQTQALVELAGRIPFLGFITLMAAALASAVLAAYWKHQYKMWDVKTACSVSERNYAEAEVRSRKTGNGLAAMRRAMLVCVLVFVLGLAQLLLFAWIQALRPAVAGAPHKNAAPSVSSQPLPGQRNTSPALGRDATNPQGPTPK